MPIMMRKHAQGERSVVAAADSNILGKKYSSGALVLDLEKFRPFYEGEATRASGLKAALKACDSANLAGEMSVGAAIDLGLAKKASILRIGGMPHLQIYRIPKN